ncbi:PEGA domain-containing protein [Patescibacteria group bacterium]|nr:PEGA domain-containing protein [Patescibacteria group bacterium]
MKKFLVWTLVAISLIAILLRFSDKLADGLFGIRKTSGISVLSEPSEATVFFDSKKVGETPYEEKNLEAREYFIKIEKGEASWQGKVNLIVGAVTVINRDIAKDLISSAGEILTLDKGEGLTVVSSPTDADVEIDGKFFGKTPTAVDVDTGDHTILVSRKGYFNRSIRVNLPKDYSMTVSVDLALSEADLTAIQTPVTTQTPELLVKDTPTGFLRVRDKASLAGKEITQVKPGDTLILLEELTGWDRVRLSDGTEGYVSSSYVEKKNP